MSQAASIHDSSADAWQAGLNRVQRPAMIIGAIGLIFTLVGLLIWPDSAMKSYLWAFLYWAAIPVGSLAFLMIQHLTGGSWGLVSRRFFEAASWLIVLIAVFAIPIVIAAALGKGVFYPWTGHEPQYGHAVNEQHLAFKKFWLTPWFFVARTIIYFAIWTILAFYFCAWSGREDRSGTNAKFAWKARFISGPGILIGSLAINFAFIDWVMTIDPAWYSTMFGVLYVVGSGLEAMAFIIIAMRLLAEVRPLRNVLSPQTLNDLGNLMFAFTMLWAYVNFSQFLIMWSGNISEETPYYYFRNKGSWGAVALFIVIFHFFTPFLILLWRRVKRDIRTLAMVALLVLVVRSVDLFWIVKPMFFQRTTWMQPLEGAQMSEGPKQENTNAGHAAEQTDGSHSQPGKAVMPPLRSVAEGMNLFDLPAIAGIGGVWIAAFIWRLKQRPILPPNDPRLAAELAGGHH